MYTLENWCNPYHCRLKHFDTPESAQEHAADIMNSVAPFFPTKEWGCYENGDVLEYTERNAPGTARVYVRITEKPHPTGCELCSKFATHRIRSGYYCDDHI